MLFRKTGTHTHGAKKDWKKEPDIEAFLGSAMYTIQMILTTPYPLKAIVFKQLLLQEC